MFIGQDTKTELGFVILQSLLLNKKKYPFISPAMGSIAPLLSFYKYGFGIKYPTKVDMSLNKETKPN